jgi:hypothetical protein
MTLPPDPGRPLDTSPEAHRVQGELYAFDLSEAARRMALAGIRRRHPDYTDEQVWCAWARLTLGDDRCREAWPNRPLVDP